MVSNRSLVAAFAALIAIPLASVTEAGAAAQCRQWDVGGRWWIQQSGQVFGYFDVDQRGDLLEGRGRADSFSNPGMSGGLDGTLEGSSVEVTVYWHSDIVGVYRGTIGPTGRIEGRTFDKRHPSKRAAWFTTNKMRCLARVDGSTAPQPPPEQKKIKVLGKGKIDLETSGAGQQAGRCLQGFVWRTASPNDLVCVTPEARARTTQENARAATRRDPNGAYGPESCISGFVWREAFAGDTVCVTPETRTLVREENRLAASRRAGG
jgi:hypothetical protein